MENSSSHRLPGNDGVLAAEGTSNSTILDAIFQRADQIAASKHNHRPVRRAAEEVKVVTYGFLMNLPWKALPSDRRILDEWGMPTVVRTEVVVAVDGRGREYELPSFPEELRHYIVDTHNQRLRQEIEKANERAKPKEFHKLQSLDDLQAVVDEQKAKEQRQEQFDRKADRKRPPLQKAGTRLEPLFAQAFKRLAKKANVTEGFLHRAGLEDYFRDVIERELEEMKGDLG
jgi:hypothetical protein